ncbi:MAG: ATP-binding protein [Acidobacteria bacterium]|nr:ATP-binding protein [Acidobacteriota bacterium]
MIARGGAHLIRMRSGLPDVMYDSQVRADESRKSAVGQTTPSALGWTVAVALVVVLLALGVANIFARATWHEVEDGVLWAPRSQGVTAIDLAGESAASRAGLRTGDVLVAIDGQPVDSPSDVVEFAHRAKPGSLVTYTLLRIGAREMIQVHLAPIPQGNSVLYYVLAAVGVFTLMVGAAVRLRRPGNQSSLHFFWLSIVFFGVFAFSPAGRFNHLDWVFYWADEISLLALGPMLLHFSLVFPDRSTSWARTALGARLLPLIYLPALLMGTARVVAIARLDGQPDLWRVIAALDRIDPLYFCLFLACAFVVLARALTHVRSVTARRQLRWIVWGTVLGGGPFAVGYALPFALGVVPSVRMELLAIPLGLIPLAFASAIVRYRLMDVEVIVKRSLVYVAAVAVSIAIYALLLRVAGWLFLENGSQTNTIIAALATLVMVLLARPVRDGFQTVLDKAFYRDRYDYRRALVGFARDLSTDLDVDRLSDRLVARVTETLVIDRMALMLFDEADGCFRTLRSQGFVGQPPELGVRSGIGARLAAGHVIALDDPLSPRRFSMDEIERWLDQGVHYFIPCVSKQATIALLVLGRKERAEPLSSEDMALLVAVAAQVATSLENGRLYQQLKQQASEVERMRQFNENILESLDNGLAVVDANDRVVRWNRSLEQLYKVRRDEAIGQRLEDLFSPAFIDALRAARPDSSSSGPAVYRMPLGSLRGRADEGLLVNIAVVPLQGDGAGAEAKGSILVFEDVTARARLEEQLQISDKMASIGLLAAGVAHEVNTPLTGISSYTQMLLERASPDDPDTKLLEKIERQTFRAAKIVNGLLTLARGGQAPGEHAPTDINGVINDVLALLEHQLKAVNVQIRRDLSPVPPVVLGMEHKLQQVFLNLFINARDAMPRGGWLSITTRTRGDEAVIDVGDTGAGIQAEHLARIYDPFFTTKSVGEGTGLGLSITYGIVHEHAGTVTCNSRVGEGTRFTVTLPLAQGASRSAAGGA